MTWFSFFLIGSSIAAGSAQAIVGPYRPLLDSLGSASKTVLIREYDTQNGGLGREYATDVPLDQAQTAITEFYQKKLLAQGWRILEQHAAISAYGKGDVVVAIKRAGPDDPGLPPRARLLKSAATPVNARFFFSIEAEPRD
jgi:hypothetical protein